MPSLRLTYNQGGIWIDRVDPPCCWPAATFFLQTAFTFQLPKFWKVFITGVQLSKEHFNIGIVFPSIAGIPIMPMMLYNTQSKSDWLFNIESRGMLFGWYWKLMRRQLITLTCPNLMLAHNERNPNYSLKKYFSPSGLSPLVPSFLRI